MHEEVTAMNSPIIAVVDDDHHIRQLVEAYLHKENYQTVGLETAEEAWLLWQTAPPDMWVLDLMLPGMDGYELCRRIRAETEVPIMMISARDTEVDKIMGLTLGSDDYMVKPFSPRELVARIKRQLERRERMLSGSTPDLSAGPGASTVQLRLGELLLQPQERRVFWAGEEKELTLKEYDLLKVLAEHPHRAFTRDELLTLVWGDDYYGSDRAVDHLIKRLRKKMVNLPVEAIWGHGYRLRVDKEGEAL